MNIGYILCSPLKSDEGDQDIEQQSSPEDSSYDPSSDSDFAEGTERTSKNPAKSKRKVDYEDR